MNSDNLNFLRKNAYFSSFSREEINDFIPYLQAVTFEEGTSLFAEGENDFGWYIILEGVVVILRDSPEGPPHTLAELSSGEAFGEMALIESTPRMASAIAIGEVDVLRLDSAVFKQLLRDKNTVAIGLLMHMAATQCSRLREITTVLQKITDDKLIEALKSEQNIDLTKAIQHRYLPGN